MAYTSAFQGCETSPLIHAQAPFLLSSTILSCLEHAQGQFQLWWRLVQGPLTPGVLQERDG